MGRRYCLAIGVRQEAGTVLDQAVEARWETCKAALRS